MTEQPGTITAEHHQRIVREAVKAAYEQIKQLRDVLKLTLEVAQQFEKQASRGTGGRRGGPVFVKARAAIANADSAIRAMGENDAD